MKKLFTICIPAYALLLTSCLTTDADFEGTEIERPEQFGEISVVGSSLGSFEHYRDILAPSFSLTADAAVAQSVATTAYKQFSSLHARSAGLSVGLQEGGQLLGGLNTSDIATEVPESVLADSNALQASSLSPSPYSSVPALGTNSLMTYRLGTALYQEVKLLENYIDKTVLDKQLGAYLVRIQVNVAPYTRTLPYDVYIDLKFELIDDEKYPRYVEILPMLAFDAVESSISGRSVSESSQMALNVLATTGAVGANLGVSDYNDLLESALTRDYNSVFTLSRPKRDRLSVRLGAHHRSESRYAAVAQTHYVTAVLLIEDDALNPGGMFPVGLDAQISFRHAVSGKPLSSYTDYDVREYSMTDESMVGVRELWSYNLGYGGEDSPLLDALESHYNLGESTEFVETLMQLQDRKFNKNSYDAEVNQRLEALSPRAKTFESAKMRALNEELRDATKSITVNSRFSLKHDELFGEGDTDIGLRQDYRQTQQLLEDYWYEGIRVAYPGEYAYDCFDIRKPSEAELPVSNYAPFLIDSGKAITTRIRGVRNVGASGLSASLNFSKTKERCEKPAECQSAQKCQCEDSFLVEAESVAVDPEKWQAVFTFPSAKKWGLGKPKALNIKYRKPGSASTSKSEIYGSLQYRTESTKPKPQTKLLIPGIEQVANESLLLVRFVGDPGQEKLTMTVSGAQVDLAQNDDGVIQVAAGDSTRIDYSDKGAIAVLKAGAVQFKLHNAIPGGKVIFTLKNEKGHSASFELPVHAKK